MKSFIDDITTKEAILELVRHLGIEEEMEDKWCAKMCKNDEEEANK